MLLEHRLLGLLAPGEGREACCGQSSERPPCPQLSLATQPHPQARPCLSAATTAADAADADLFLPAQPLRNLTSAFRSTEAMRDQLPAAVYGAYEGTLRELHGLLPQGAAAPPAQLPWRSYGAGAGRHAARDATAWLGRQLEAAEAQKAHLRWVARAPGCGLSVPPALLG